MNNQNLLEDYKDMTESFTEPVTLGEMKDYLRLEGFVDTDESTIDVLSDFDSDDELLEDLIKAAREKAEKFAGCSFIAHTWKVLFTNGAGDFELPFGPVTDFTSLAYKNGTAVGAASITMYGFDFQVLDYPRGEKMTAIYEAGYEDCPEEVRLAIKQCVAYWYEKRMVGDIPELALATLQPFKRAWTWLA
jgi:hypothetical protein